jgi:hypothetical protein
MEKMGLDEEEIPKITTFSLMRKQQISTDTFKLFEIDRKCQQQQEKLDKFFFLN